MIQQVEGVELLNPDRVHALQIAGGEGGETVVSAEGHETGSINGERLQDRLEFLGAGLVEGEVVDALDLVVDQLGQQCVAVGQTPHLLGHLVAIGLLHLVLGKGDPAALPNDGAAASRGIAPFSEPGSLLENAV